MEDIFQWCREGNAMQVRVWLDDTEHDMNQGYSIRSPYMEFNHVRHFGIPPTTHKNIAQFITNYFILDSHDAYTFPSIKNLLRF